MNNWLVSQEGILLRQQAEIVFGKPILYSYECESLSNQIKITTGLDISAQTLRRMWGFIKDGVAISKRSEQIVLKYVGIDEIKTLLKIKSKDTLITSEEKVLADFMKQFYEVESVNEDDINYQIANYKIFIKVISSEAMLAYLGPYFAKHPIAQVYFFEKAPYFDGICGSYQLYFKMYLKHKNTAEAQLFGNCVLHFAALMQENIKEGEALLKKINQIDENLSSHAFPVARKVMANLTQGYMNKDQQQIETWTKIAFQWHNKIKPANKRESYFPFYPFVVADAFNLIGDYEMALKMIEIGELDYMRFKDIAFNNGFHGRTSASVAVTDNPSINAPINLQQKVTFLALNDIEGVKRELEKGDVCAVIVEFIQGVGGLDQGTAEFFEQVDELCKFNNTFFIADEVQSGYGRSGKFFAFQHYKVAPDVISIAKGMGNGFPVGGVLIHPGIEAKYGMLGTTFGGNHLACAAGLAVLNTLEEEHLIENVQKVADHFISEAKNILP
mgnify:CR=1 FL=1